MSAHYRRGRCRLCDAGSLENVLSLKATPPANELVASPTAADAQAVFPRDVHLCAACGHLQLVDVVEVVVFSSGANALLDGAHSRIRWLLFPEEVGHKRDHARHGE